MRERDRERDREVTETLGRLESVAARTNNDCVCVCMGFCYRADLGDTGKHPEPKSIFDFEPGKGEAVEDRNKVRDSCHPPSPEH